MRLRDKAVIVPGGGKGIGLRYLRGFAAESAAVAVSEIDASAHSSGTARKGSAGFLHYVTSKAAIAGSTDGPGPFGARRLASRRTF